MPQEAVSGKGARGQVLLWVLIAAGLLTLFTSTILFMLVNEGRWSVKQKRSATAYQLAESAVERGYWKLIDWQGNSVTPSNWKMVGSTTAPGGPLPGYEGTTYYQDVSNDPYRQYTILISTYSTTGSTAPTGVNLSTDNVRVITGRGFLWKVGVDTATTRPVDMRAIEAVYKNVTADFAIYGGKVEVEGNAVVHWGPVMSTKQLKLGGSSDDFFPRKFSKSFIKCDTMAHQIPPVSGHWDEDPAPPNTDGQEWWTYYSVPSFPTINFGWYQTQAKNTFINGTNLWYKQDADFGKKDVDPDHKNQGPIINNHADADRVYFCDRKAKLDKAYLKGTLIALGDVDFKGKGKGSYAANIPENASLEYVKYDNMGLPAWPGKPGPPTVTTYALDSVQVEGFTYCGKEFEAEGTSVLNGSFYAPFKETEVGGNIAIYYKQDVNIVVTSPSILRKGWREILPIWP